MKVQFTLSIGFPTSSRKEIVDLEDNLEDDEIEEEYSEWRNQFLDGGWKKTMTSQHVTPRRLMMRERAESTTVVEVREEEGL